MACIFTIPMYLINKFVYARLVHKPFVMLETFWLDIAILVTYIGIFRFHVLWQNRTNIGMGLDPNPSSGLMYIHEYNDHLSKNEVNISLLIGLLAFFGYMRLLIGLKVTKTLGPIISTIIYMFKDIGVFIVIWFIVLISFTMVAVLTFNEVPEISKIQYGLVYFIRASFGEYDLGIYDFYILNEP